MPNRQGGWSSHRSDGRVVLAVGPPEPEPAGPGQPLDDGRLGVGPEDEPADPGGSPRPLPPPAGAEAGCGLGVDQVGEEVAVLGVVADDREVGACHQGLSGAPIAVGPAGPAGEVDDDLIGRERGGDVEDVGQEPLGLLLLHRGGPGLRLEVLGVRGCR